jgi:hypothetical protein
MGWLRRFKHQAALDCGGAAYAGTFGAPASAGYSVTRAQKTNSFSGINHTQNTYYFSRSSRPSPAPEKVGPSEIFYLS